ncbi:MAG TPA: isoleucine--tRNA ligase [Candidatus Cybelea sp.]|nr:isoleucine--tRNA ligase [Candidatus Cybelea sp.]
MTAPKPRDYKSTVFLPQTDFPMKAGLPKREPELLARWRSMNLYRRLRSASEGREKFILHDGPPYANGHLHIGTALNKILKDVVNRSQQMLGKDANYVPGWDCHGLPIEWKIEEQYRAAGKNKDEVPIVEFRRECREFAEHWIGVQREEFRRLGVEGDWDNPYTTMSYSAEAQTVRELLKFLMNGSLYRGAKPVMWSVVEKTALAEAEIEYHDHTSPTVYIKFPVIKPSVPAAAGAGIVIWTTTPWTLPGNRAIACKSDAAYGRFRIDAVGEKSMARAGDEVIVALDLAEATRAGCGIASWTQLASFAGADLVGTVCAHPLRGQGYDFDVPVLAGDFVTMDQGTGFVHIAPGHGMDDFELGSMHKLEMPATVGEDGAYYAHVPLFAGKRVLTPAGKDGDANRAVGEAIQAAGGMLGRGRLVHSYPHSWRSKAPLIFRNTPQWFVSMTETGLRETALRAIDKVRWVPGTGRNRIRGMIENRPDWLLSRQRTWGVPLTLFFDKETGQPLRDERVNERIVAAVEKGGADAWFTGTKEQFLGNEYDAAKYEKVDDILDVWFDSGSTHSFVLEQRPDLQWPASLYLEGSDQHRGWFHSSLLESCGTRGRAPYEAVLTHGFTMDSEGRKMSKSLGNTIEPEKIVSQHGADILRLWVVSTDYTEDQRIGPEIIKAQVEAYRKLRNTLRYVLGNLAGFAESERLPREQMPELDRWILHRLSELDEVVRRSVNDFDFHAVFVAIYSFCVVDLSAFYFDIRKDSLYCDGPSAVRRRAARTVLDEIFSYLTAWLAPILCFTAEETWLARFPGEDASVHLRTFPVPPGDWRDDMLGAKWNKVRELRRVVTGALEIERRDKRIGASLQAHPTIFAAADYAAALAGVDLAELCITSAATLRQDEGPAEAFRLSDVPGVAVMPGMAAGQKCQRCWQVLPEVGHGAGAPDLCRRCDDVVAATEAGA